MITRVRKLLEKKKNCKCRIPGLGFNLQEEKQAKMAYAQKAEISAKFGHTLCNQKMGYFSYAQANVIVGKRDTDQDVNGAKSSFHRTLQKTTS